MAVISNALRHPDQLPKMSKTLGVDLEQAISASKLTNIQLHDIAFRCSECREKNACDTWLAAHRDGASEAPEYCLNKETLEGLRG